MAYVVLSSTIYNLHLIRVMNKGLSLNTQCKKPGDWYMLPSLQKGLIAFQIAIFH